MNKYEKRLIKYFVKHSAPNDCKWDHIRQDTSLSFFNFCLKGPIILIDIVFELGFVYCLKYLPNAQMLPIKIFYLMIFVYPFLTGSIVSYPLMGLLHKFLPGKNERELEIHKQLDLRFNVVVEPVRSLSLSGLSVKEICRQYFNKDGSGFIRFMDERMKDDALFINYALSIPKAKEMSVDSLRKVLLTYNYSFNLTRPLNLEGAFSEYSAEEVERAFCGVGWNIKTLTAVVPALSSRGPLEVVRNLSFLKEKSVPLELLPIDGLEEGGFSFKILTRKEEYERTSDLMRNCMRTKFTNPNSIMVVTHMESGYMTALELKGMDITQMAGPNDSVSKYRSEIMQVFGKYKLKGVCLKPHGN